MSVLVALLLALVAGWQLSLVGVAGANVSPSFHELPWTGEDGVVQSPRCANISPGYACTDGGYAAWLAHPSGWAWADYGGSYPSHNKYGPHNCTLYVAYQLQVSGITLSWSANASSWASAALSNGAAVNSTPSVGSVAQWNTGHVAFVDAVTARYILITSDNYQPYGVATMPGGFTDSFVIARNSPAMPDNFIHFATPAPVFIAVLHTR
ncbi:MAG TPA: CHAP domain-containing protein [Acidimicrobiales bacterium]|jgi:surface antigen|nr:CHAP domain-containing protein [Acidimicrobiales bacterium]